MRPRLDPDVIEVSYEAGSFPAAVKRVPAVAQLDESGRGWIAYGDVSERRLEQWIADGP